MKELDIDYTQFLSLVDSKSLLLQFSDGGDRYSLFAVEGNVSWNCTVLKNSKEATDFETNRKSNSNKPLEYRSSDGLVKVAPSKFSDSASFMTDGVASGMTAVGNATTYVKRHFTVPFKLAGVDVYWYGANWGDYVDFEVGFYTNVNQENTFIQMNQFGTQYKIYQNGNRTFDVQTVATIPVQYNGYDVYVRIKYVNAGAASPANDAKFIVNFLGWI